MISSWIFDEFIICATIFLIPPTSALSLPLCVPHPPANCVNITRFHLIYQDILQRIFGMLSVKIGSFLTMLRYFCLPRRHSQTLPSQQNPQRYMHSLHPALRPNSIPFLLNIFQHNTLNQKFLIPAHIDPSCLKTEATVLIKILISNPKFQFAIYFISSFTTSSKSVISLLPLTCHIPVIPGFIASRAR